MGVIIVISALTMLPSTTLSIIVLCSGGPLSEPGLISLFVTIPSEVRCMEGYR